MVSAAVRRARPLGSAVFFVLLSALVPAGCSAPTTSSFKPRDEVEAPTQPQHPSDVVAIGSGSFGPWCRFELFRVERTDGRLEVLCDWRREVYSDASSAQVPRTIHVVSGRTSLPLTPAPSNWPASSMGRWELERLRFVSARRAAPDYSELIVELEDGRRTAVPMIREGVELPPAEISALSRELASVRDPDSARVAALLLTGKVTSTDRWPLMLVVSTLECVLRFPVCEPDPGVVAVPERLLQQCWERVLHGSSADVAALTSEVEAWCTSVHAGHPYLRQFGQILSHYFVSKEFRGGSPFADRAQETIEVALGDLAVGQMRVAGIEYADAVRLSASRILGTLQSRLSTCGSHCRQLECPNRNGWGH